MIEQEFAAALLAASGLTDLVSDRIFPGRATPKAALPYVVWRRADTNPGDTFNTNTAAHVAEFECDVFAETYAQAKETAAQVKAALDGLEGSPPASLMSASLAIEFDDFDSAAGTHRAGLAFDVLYRK